MIKSTILTILYILFTLTLSPNLYAADTEGEAKTEIALDSKVEDVKTLLIKEEDANRNRDEEKPLTEENIVTEKEVEEEEECD